MKFYFTTSFEEDFPFHQTIMGLKKTSALHCYPCCQKQHNFHFVSSTLNKSEQSGVTKECPHGAHSFALIVVFTGSVIPGMALCAKYVVTVLWEDGLT